MPHDTFDEKSTLVQEMAWCLSATGHYLGQCSWGQSVGYALVASISNPCGDFKRWWPFIWQAWLHPGSQGNMTSGIQWMYQTGVLSDMEWLNTAQLKYPDCVCIVESDTYPSPGVTRLCPRWLGTWLTWSPCGHCNMQWDTCFHLVTMAASK